VDEIIVLQLIDNMVFTLLFNKEGNVIPQPLAHEACE